MYSRSSYYTWIGICIKLRQLDLMLAHKRTHHLVICYKPGRFAACRVYIKPCPRIRGSEYPSSRSIELASLLHPSPTSSRQQVHSSIIHMGISGSPVLALASQDEERKPRPYTPSIWGDFFLQHQPCTPSQVRYLQISIFHKKRKKIPVKVRACDELSTPSVPN